MKKWISIFLSVLLLMAMTGCGQSADGTEDQESSPDPENTASADQQEEAADDTAGSEEEDSPVVYMTTDISPEGLMAIYEALGAESGWPGCRKALYRGNRK